LEKNKHKKIQHKSGTQDLDWYKNMNRADTRYMPCRLSIAGNAPPFSSFGVGRVIPRNGAAESASATADGGGGGKSGGGPGLCGEPNS